jgi:CheY-like chemotaxis protein
MAKSLLWLDNDPGQIESLLKALERKGYHVTLCRRVSDAELLLETTRYDLLMLDVMIPISEGELANYPYEATDNTLATGLTFYRRVRSKLKASNTPVLVMTVRIDKPIATAFVAAGLPPDYFVTRHEVKNTQVFLQKVAEVVGGADDGQRT